MDICKSLSSEYPEIPANNFSSIKIGLTLNELKVKKMRSDRGITYSLIKNIHLKLCIDVELVIFFF